jgi:hypothetical protein
MGMQMDRQKEGELFAKLDMLVDLARRNDTRLNKVEADIAELRGEIRGRLEEQSRLLNSLVPQKVAAVGAR